MIKKTLLMLLISGLVTSASFAQNKSNKKSVRIFATDIPEDVQNPLTFIANGVAHERTFHPAHIDKAIPVGEDGIVQVVNPFTDDDGEISYQLLAKAKVPESITRALLILVPLPAAEVGPKFRTKIIDLSKLSAGGILYINFSAADLVIEYDGERSALDSGKLSMIDSLKGKSEAMVKFSYHSKSKGEEKWRRMTTFSRPVYNSRREICIFYFDERIESIAYRAVPFTSH